MKNRMVSCLLHSLLCFVISLVNLLSVFSLSCAISSQGPGHHPQLCPEGHFMRILYKGWYQGIWGSFYGGRILILLSLCRAGWICWLLGIDVRREKLIYSFDFLIGNYQFCLFFSPMTYDWCFCLDTVANITLSISVGAQYENYLSLAGYSSYASPPLFTTPILPIS